jgi:hypothetical protein
MFAADHRNPIKGDHNLQYLPKDGKEEEFKAWEQYAALMGDIAASEPVASPRRTRA